MIRRRVLVKLKGRISVKIMVNTLNQDLLKWSGTTGKSKNMFYFEFKTRRYAFQQCGKAETIANLRLNMTS